MKKYFNLKSPCKDCPFRTDINFHLDTERVVEITNALVCGQSFACHKTTIHDDDGESVRHDGEMHCAGAMIMLEKMGLPNQIMRIGERIGMYDAQAISMDAPVFPTAQAMVNEFKRRNTTRCRHQQSTHKE